MHVYVQTSQHFLTQNLFTHMSIPTKILGPTTPKFYTPLNCTKSH